jgi:TonB family protein
LAGVHGATVTELYWPSASGEGENTVEHPSPKATASRSRVKLQNKPSQQLPSLDTLAANDHAGELGVKESPQAGASAGNPYGSLSSGNDLGHEIRAALPVTTFEPIVDRSQLPGGVEGNCIVEITIDEAGAVVSASVVQSLGPAIDGSVLAAVERWHFRPATRDGVPIPSKQDVVYHFKTA